jgi:hypothetical protein
MNIDTKGQLKCQFHEGTKQAARINQSNQSAIPIPL